jgi:lipopolysaccharide transport system ATP-binding protein
MSLAIKVENLSKAYQLGQIGTGTLGNDLSRWAARIRGKEDPFLKLGEENDRTVRGTSGVVWSLKDINFEIEQGDAVGIIGRNGAGKSTLLKLLSRVTSPTRGEINVKGRIASLLEVGTGFHPELSGRENIFLNGAILGMRKREIQKKFDEIVDFSGVQRYIDTPVKRYSSGMYVRLAFAVAAHLECEIIIVDEVLAVGDTEFQKKCIDKMSEVSKGEGRTILFVSHNMGAIRKLCNKGILFDKGKVKYSGDMATTLEEYFLFSSGTTKDRITPGFINWNTKEVGNDECYISYVSIIQKGKPVNVIDAGKEFWIEVGYELNKPVRDFCIGINIMDQNNEFVLHSADLFAFDNSDACPREEGKNISRCIVPANYLNAGSYALNVVADIPNVKLFFELNSVLKFKIENVSVAASKYPSHMWRGVLNPESVQWELAQIEHVS